MKKVGIITYKDIADGKGRFLQAHALYSVILNLGYTPEIIDYYPISIASNKKSIIYKLARAIANPKRWLGYILKLQHTIFMWKFRTEFKQKRKAYELFIKDNINVTENKFIGYEALLKAKFDHDVFVCGSDQIWNPNFQGLDLAYYLKFAPANKRIAYAPSLGTTEIDGYQMEVIKNNIEGMAYISVREKSGAEIISKISGRNVSNVIDPTLLMSQEWWRKLAGDVTPEKPYVLTFLFDNNKHPRYVANEIAKRYGYDVICIPDTFADMFFKGKKEISIGPERFVNLFMNASFICTQSFHGAILSLIYNRPFYVFQRETKGSGTSIFSRINDLLSMVNLENRIIKTGDTIPKIINDIDYSKVNSILDLKREESLDYLRSALYEIVGGNSDVSSYR